MVAAVLGAVVQTAPALLLESAVDSAADNVPRVELAIARGVQGEGLAVPAKAVNATLGALAGAAPVSLYMLTEVPGNEPSLGCERPARLAAQVTGAQSVAVRTTGAPRAGVPLRPVSVRICRRSRGGSTAQRCGVCVCRCCWRVGALVVAIIGANVQWMMLARQRDAINTQMTELLLNTFPKTTVVLDAPDQMSRQLQQLRVAAGELSPDDFLSLADRPRALAARRCRSTASPRSTITTGVST